MANQAYRFSQNRASSLHSTAKYPLKNGDSVVHGTLLELTGGEVTVLSTGDPYAVALREQTGDGEATVPIEILCKDFMAATSNADLSDSDIGSYFNVAQDTDGYHVIDKTSGSVASGMVLVTEVFGAREAEVVFTQRSSAADQT